MWSQLPRSLKLLLASSILANTSGRMTGPFMPLYILALGGSVAQVGIFATVETLATALMRPLGGWLSDSIGRLQAVAIGTVFGLIGTTGYALSPTWQWLLIAAVFLAIGRSFVGPSFQGYIAEVAPQGRTAQTFGLVNGLFATCQIIGPLLGGWLVEAYDLRLIFWIGAVLMAAASVLRILPAVGLPFVWQNVRATRLTGGLRTLLSALVGGGLFTWLFVTDSLRDMGDRLVDSFQPLLLKEVGAGEREIGLFFAYFAVVYLLVSLFASRLADRWGPVRALVLSGLISSAALALIAQFPALSTAWAYATLLGLSSGLNDPAFDAFLAQSTPPERLGLTFGLFSTAISVFSTPMPYLASLLWLKVDITAPFWAASAVMLVSAAATYFLLQPYAQPAR